METNLNGIKNSFFETAEIKSKNEDNKMVIRDKGGLHFNADFKDTDTLELYMKTRIIKNFNILD
jgi:hypothetical protein